jgi:aminopeptidase YwaD
VGSLAEPPLIRHLLKRLRPIIIITLSGLLLSIFACNSNGDQEAGAPAPTTEPPAPTASPAPTIDPNFNSALALEHTRQLAVVIGIRAAGTDGEARAAEYISSQLAEYGYTTSIQEFPIQVVTDAGSKVDLVPPDTRTITALGMRGSFQGTAQGTIVPAGRGRVEDFPTNTRGNIVLIERGDLTFAMKVANASAAGAVGVVIYNSEPGNFGGGLSDGSTIPVASISQEDGHALTSGAAAAGKLEVRLKEETLTSRNVVAEPVDGSCEIVAGGHFDSVPAGPGANDNGSGTAVVLEMARTRAARGQADGVCYVLFGSEEIGLVGSNYYVNQLPDTTLAALKAMLNFDMLSVGDTWPLIGSPEVTDIAVVEAQELGVPYKVSRTLPDNLGSDQASFAQAGVPAMIFNCFCDANYHTAEDKFEFVSETRLAEAGIMGLGMIETLLAS